MKFLSFPLLKTKHFLESAKIGSIWSGSKLTLKICVSQPFIDQFSIFFELDRWKINFRNTQFLFRGVPTLQSQRNVQN